MEQKKLFLVDAFAIIFRAYYALIRSPRITSKGKNTNAQFGFTNAIIDLLKNQKPSHIAICFDSKGETERHVDFADYKANRQEAPEDLLLAIPDIKRIVKALDIPIIEVTGYEADDIVGTLAKQASAVGYEVLMVTPDKDYGQLVSDTIKIYKPGYQGGDVEIMGPKEVCAKWGISRVDQVIDMLGLMGDAVDNIPGIPGVGEKTAAKLLAEYDTLENVLDNAQHIKGKMGEKIAAGRASAIMSKKLATIILNVPCQFNEADFKVSDWHKDELIQVFEELEFRTMAKRLLDVEIGNAPTPQTEGQLDMFSPPTPQGGSLATPQVNKSVFLTNPDIDSKIEKLKILAQTPPLGGGGAWDLALATIATTEHTYTLIQSKAEIENLVTLLLQQAEICMDTETTGLDAMACELVGISFSYQKTAAYYIPCPENQTEVNEILSLLQPLFTHKNITWVGQNIKYDLLVLKNYGVTIEGGILDTMLMHYVTEPEGKRSMDAMAMQYLNYNPISITELIGKKGVNQADMRSVAIETVKEYAAEDADITLQLKHILLPTLTQKEVEKVFYEVENPLVKVLANMEYEGVKIDVEFLNNYEKELQQEADIAEQSVYDQAGIKFNLASPKQLGEVLFDHLKLDPKAKKTKTGQYATGEDVLTKLAKQHKIVDDILAFRELTKLNNTYVQALPTMVNSKTGRVHTSYSQAIAVTGRLSSVNPNLQNIPVRTPKGREIRKAFIPRNTDYTFLSADYSQIELRIVAAISGDPAMCQAFIDGKDIHTATAAKVYNVAEADVTKEMRYKAKSVNFGIIYGQGAFGLAENLGISRSEAKEIIDNYKREFTGIQKYMDDTINFAKENGYVQTLMGRKRWLADINSSNFTVRGFAERNAINSPIQGSAADMIKLAMIKIDAAMQLANLKSKMILQVHDELIFDTHLSEVAILKSLILANMQTAMVLPNGVPVIAECGEGRNWLEAH